MLGKPGWKALAGGIAAGVVASAGGIANAGVE